MERSEDWDDLLIYLANPQSQDLASARLEKTSGSWPTDVSQLQESFELASRVNLQELLNMHLLARVLLAREQAPKWLTNWLCRNLSIEAILPDVPWKLARDLFWVAVPIPIVRIEGQGGVFEMITASYHPCQSILIPDWVRDVLEQNCLSAIIQAVQAAHNLGFLRETHRGFYCWPLINPAGPPVKGESLGLPMSIALSLLEQKSVWPKSLMATGGISPEGKVLPVGGVRTKLFAAADSGVQLFLYPDDERIDITESPVPALPVSDLSQAMTFAHLMGLGLPEVAKFRLYYSCLQNPELMLDNFHQIPISVLQWAQGRGLLDPVKEICRDIDGFSSMVSILGDKSLSLEHREILASLLEEKDLEELASRSSQDALMVSNWYQCLLTLAEEADDLEKSRFWKNRAKKLLREFGNKIYVFYRTEEYRSCYQRLDAELCRGLSILKTGPLKELISPVLRNQQYYLHLPVKRDDNVSVRVFFSESNKIVALSLNALLLDIDPDSGRVKFVEDCLYALYLGLIRAVLETNREDLLADMEFHKLLAGYLGETIKEVLRKGDLYINGKKEKLLCWACNYYYAISFLRLTPEGAACWIPDSGSEEEASRGCGIDPSRFQQISPGPRKLSGMLNSLGITPEPDWLWHRLLNAMDKESLYALDGALDHFMGLCVISSYPTTLFDGLLHSNQKVGRQVESILLPYLKNIRYSSGNQPNAVPQDGLATNSHEEPQSP